MKSPLTTDLNPEQRHLQREPDEAPSGLELPADRPRPPVPSFRGATRALRLPAAVTASLRQVAGREGASLDMLLLAGLAALLARYSGAEDIVIGAAGPTSLLPLRILAELVNIGTLLAFVIVCIAIMLLRHTDPERSRPFRTPWVPFVPMMGILFNGYMMYKLGWLNWARLIIWLVIGLVVYFTYSRKHSRVQTMLNK